MIGSFLHFDQGSQSSRSRWSQCCIVGNWTCFSFFLRGSVLTHSLRTRVSCGGQATVTRMCQSVCRAIVIKLLFLWRVRTSWPWEKEHSRWADARHRAGWQVLCRAESCVCVLLARWQPWTTTSQVWMHLCPSFPAVSPLLPSSKYIKGLKCIICSAGVGVFRGVWGPDTPC